VIVVAAVARTKDKKGRSCYSADGLNLASFRESSELEFGADDAFILVPDGDDAVTLRHLKARHTEAKDLTLAFDRSCQRFTSTDTGSTSRTDTGRMRAELDALWDGAGEDGADESEDQL
jgi:replicative DNA helicase